MANGTSNPLKLAVAGWKDGVKAMGAMPRVILTAWILLIVLYLVFALYEILMNNLAAHASGFLWQVIANILLRAVTAAIFVVYCAVIVPLLIAVHRFVLLGEVTQRYSVDHLSARYGLYYGVVFALSLIWQSTLVLVIRPLVVKEPAHVPIYVGNILATYSVGFVVIAAAVMLLPAAAIDAAEASQRNFWLHALNEAAAHIWRVLGVLALVTIPMAMLRFASVWLVVAIGAVRIYQPFFLIMAEDLAQFVLAVAVYAATVSLLYRELRPRADSALQTAT